MKITEKQLKHTGPASSLQRVISSKSGIGSRAINPKKFSLPSRVLLLETLCNVMKCTEGKVAVKGSSTQFSFQLSICDQVVAWAPNLVLNLLISNCSSM